MTGDGADLRKLADYLGSGDEPSDPDGFYYYLRTVMYSAAQKLEKSERRKKPEKKAD